MCIKFSNKHYLIIFSWLLTKHCPCSAWVAWVDCTSLEDTWVKEFRDGTDAVQEYFHTG